MGDGKEQWISAPGRCTIRGAVARFDRVPCRNVGPLKYMQASLDGAILFDIYLNGMFMKGSDCLCR